MRHDDPEYLKAHNLLSAIQRQQVFQKQRQIAQHQLQAQQQQQQQQRQHQLNGVTPDGAANGSHGKAATTITTNRVVCASYTLRHQDLDSSLMIFLA